MEKKTTSIRTIGFLTLFDYHTQFFKKALAGISEEDMLNRLNTEANHPAWIAGSLVQQRFRMTSETGTGMKQTNEELFLNNKGIQANMKYPGVDVYLKDWDRITPEARYALTAIDDAKLDSQIEMGGMKMTYYELISFTIYREANMIGQLALWRRLLGYPALKYD
ncbi:MAG: DinB family protein [Flavisolibacter sp.]